MPNGGKSHAGGDAVFKFLRTCRHGILFEFGIVPPADPRAAPGNRLPAVYRRIQVASPPPARADRSAWESGILFADDTDALQPFQPAGGGNGWRHRRVLHVEDIASLGQPEPGTIVLDQWLTVPDNPTTLEFNDEVDHLGFLSASYPQPDLGHSGVARVPVDYYFGAYDIRWPDPLPANKWLAISFDRFWPPERESVEYLAQVGACDPPHD